MKATSLRKLVALALLLFFAFLFPPAVGAQTYIFGRADLPVGNAPTAIAIGDFNGDGLIDMAVTNSNDNTVSVLVGRPYGTFSWCCSLSVHAEVQAAVQAAVLTAHRQGNILLQ